MDEVLRRALRDGHPERTRALRERAGDDPFAKGPVTLPTVELPLALALAEGGGALALVDPRGTLELWDVASTQVSARHEGVVHPRSLALREDGWVAWIDDAGLHGGWLTAEAPPRLLHELGEQECALSADARWLGSLSPRGVELEELGPAGAPNGRALSASLDLLGEHAFVAGDDYAVELVRLGLCATPEGPCFAALGVESRDEYCCSSEWHTHFRHRHGLVLLVGTPAGCWTLRQEPDWLSEEAGELLVEARARPPLVGAACAAVSQRARVVGLTPAEVAARAGLRRGAGGDPPHCFAGTFFSDEGLELNQAWTLLALDPGGELLLAAHEQTLIALPLRGPEGKLLTPDPLAPRRLGPVSGPVVFSPSGEHVAWTTPGGVVVRPTAGLRALAPGSGEG
ncbi:MAG: hypothetical protein R3F62_03305 [Planctomycetota bacterium]